MRIPYSKYHALENDFIVIDSEQCRLAASSLPRLAAAICHRRRGIGADGIAWIRKSHSADARIDIYNADGSWAEKSGNALRIVGVHLHKNLNRRRSFTFETGTSLDFVQIGKKSKESYSVTVELGRPDFSAQSLPVKTSRRSIINRPLKIGPVALPVTCLSVGNPHTLMVVDNFDFDWQKLGAEMEKAKLFPRGTNVEFVRVLTPRRLQVAEWERGVGATGSSGTGAAAAVCAMVMLGLAERRCSVKFPAGLLKVNWRSSDDVIELTGPVELITTGTFLF